MPTANNDNYITDVFDVFDRVKDGFVYTNDMDQYGAREDWRFPTDFDNVIDDCDGFAIACRGLLKEKGHECRLLFCRTETGEGHLICAIGKLALDNRMKFPVEIVYLTETVGYSLLSISGLNPGDAWHGIAGVNTVP